MQFKEKYTTAALAEVGKIELSDADYAKCELLQELIFMINKKLK